MDLKGRAGLFVATIAVGHAAASGQVILNEFLANPSDVLTTEWVELYAIAGDSVSLADWSIGDSRVDYTIGATVSISEGDFIVLADDSEAFRIYYPDFTGTLIQPSSWPTLNNTGDTVRLLDPAGIEVNRFGYTDGFDGNHTWCRSAPESDFWGRSANSGGSPGEQNSLIEYAEGSSVSLSVEPRIFSPDGDGHDDQVSIFVEAPEAESYSLRIFDKNGVDINARIEGNYANQPYIWRGRRYRQDRAAVGIYIVYFQTSDGDAARKTVVVAR